MAEKIELEACVSDLHILKQIRNYFGENDAMIFHHSAFAVIDKIIKKIESQPQQNEVEEDEKELEARTERNMILIDAFCEYLKNENIVIPEKVILSFFNA